VGFNFLPVERDQGFLLPPDVRDWLPEGHLVWFVLDAVELLDLSGLRSAYRADGHGGAAHDPAMMTALLIYAYCAGERSSRRIERRCADDVAFRVVAGGSRPDHVTIARFRSRHQQALAGLFAQVLRLCAEVGLVRAGRVALDGTKLRADASSLANRRLSSLEHEIKEILDEAASTDAAEDAEHGLDLVGDEPPEPVRGHRSRLDRLRAARDRLAEQDAKDQAEQDAKLERYEKRVAAGGKPGNKPNPTKPKQRSSVPRANTTDPDCRPMSTTNGVIPAYNAQAVVTEDQVVLAAETFQAASDAQLLEPMLDAVKGQLKALPGAGPATVWLADNGYLSEANCKLAAARGVHAVIAPDSDRRRRRGTPRQRPRTKGRHPGVEAMTERVATPCGEADYQIRKQTVEPVFGQIKTIQNFRRFSRRGLTAAADEWKFVCATHNLLKIYRHRYA
jgi:transposase